MYKKALLAVLICFFFMSPLYAMECSFCNDNPRSKTINLYSLLTKLTNDRDYPTMVPSSFKSQKAWTRNGNDTLLLSVSLEKDEKNRVSDYPALAGYQTVDEVINYLKTHLKKALVSSELYPERQSLENFRYEHMLELCDRKAEKMIEYLYNNKELEDIKECFLKNQKQALEAKNEFLNKLINSDISIEIRFNYPKTKKGSKAEKNMFLVIKLETVKDYAQAINAQEFPGEIDQIFVSLSREIAAMFIDQADNTCKKLERATPFGLYG
jgi:hypothetical protein